MSGHFPNFVLIVPSLYQSDIPTDFWKILLSPAAQFAKIYRSLLVRRSFRTTNHSLFSPFSELSMDALINRNAMLQCILIPCYCPKEICSFVIYHSRFYYLTIVFPSEQVLQKNPFFKRYFGFSSQTEINGSQFPG